MPDDKEIIQAIFGAVDEINRQLPPEKQLEKSADTALFGRSSVLDSLGFVTLLAAIEQKIEEDFGITLILASEKAISREDNPFETIGTLAGYILSLLEQDSNV